MLKPIEKGCMAMIINTGIPENDGQIVTVLECLGEMVHPDTFKIHMIWRVDHVGPTNKGTMSDLIRESRLMRIDGGEFEDEDTEELVVIER